MRTFLKRKLKNILGFTLTELLVVIAIIGILAGFGFVAVVQNNKRLTLLEMDDTAKKIFLAAQNHLTIADTSGAWKQLVAEADSPSGSIDGSDKPSLGGESGIGTQYKVIYGGKAKDGAEQGDVTEALNLILPVNSVNISSDGSYAIIYNPETATIYGVYYSASSTFGNGDTTSSFYSVVKEDQTKNIIRNKSNEERKKQNPLIGYYGNAKGVQKNPDTKLDALEKLRIRFINDKDSLRLEITDPNGIIKDTESLKALTLTVTGEESQKTISLSTDSSKGIPDFKDGAISTPTSVKEDGSDKTCYQTTILFDSITKEGFHFANLFEGFYPGENIIATVTLVRTSTTTGTEIVSDTASDNSLFEQVYPSTNGFVARVSNIRHLENLSQEISGIVSQPVEGATSATKFSVRKAILTKKIDLAPDKDGYNGQSIFQYVDSGTPLSRTLSANENFVGIRISPSSGLTAFEGNNKTISNLKVSGAPFAGESDTVGSGLFSTVDGDFSISNLTIEKPIIKGSANANAGTLIGTFNGGKLSISHVSVIGDDQTSSEINTGAKVSGGLHVGGFVGSMNETGTADTEVKNEIYDSYFLGGHQGYVASLSGGNAGGLIGNLNTGSNNLSIRNAYSTAYVQGTGAYGAGGFIGAITDGTGSVSITNSYVGGRTKDKYYLANNETITEDTLDSHHTEGGYNVISTGGSAGGFIGVIKNTPVTISNAYTTASVYATASGNAGGFIGSIASGTSVSCGNTYTTAFVHNDDANLANVGLFVGGNNAAINATSGQNNYAFKGVVAKDGTAAGSEIENATNMGVSGDSFKLVGNKDADTPYLMPENRVGKNAKPYDQALISEAPYGDFSFKTIDQLSGETANTKARNNISMHFGDWPELKEANSSDQTYAGDFGILYYEIVQHGYNGTKDYYFHGYVGDLTAHKENGTWQHDTTYREVWTDDDQHSNKLTLQNNGKGLLTGHNQYVTEEGYLILVGDQFVKDNYSTWEDSGHQPMSQELSIRIGIDSNNNSTRLAINQYIGKYQNTLDGKSITEHLGLKGYTAYCINADELASEASQSVRLEISLETYQNGNRQGEALKGVNFYFQPIFSDTLSQEPPTNNNYGTYEIRSAAQLNRMFGHGGNSAVSSVQGGKAEIKQTLDISYSTNLQFTKFDRTTESQVSLTSNDSAYKSPIWSAQMNGHYYGSTPNAESSTGSPVDATDAMGNGTNTYYRLRYLTSPLFNEIGNNGTNNPEVEKLIVEDTNCESFVKRIIGRMSDVTFINCRFNKAPIGTIDSQGKVQNCDVINGQMGAAGMVDTLTNEAEIINCHVYGDKNLAINGNYLPNSYTEDNDLSGEEDPLYGYNLVTVGKIPDSGTDSGTDTPAGFVRIDQTNNNRQISFCSFTGKVYGKNAAGFVGTTYNPKIQNCYANALVYGTDIAAAFAVNVNGGTIDRCHALGIIGQEDDNKDGSGFISNFKGGAVKNSYSAVWKSNTTRYNPFAGNGTFGTLENCYVMIDLEVPAGFDTTGWNSESYKGVQFRTNSQMSTLTVSELSNLGVKASYESTVAYYQYLPKKENIYPYPMPDGMTAYGDWGRSNYNLEATVVNGEDLYLKITDPEIAGGFTKSMNRYTVTLKGISSGKTVKLELNAEKPDSSDQADTGKVTVTVQSETKNSNANFHGRCEAKSNRTETKILLDSVSSQNGHFTQLFPDFKAGEDIEITSITANPLNKTKVVENVPVSNATFNSLFAEKETNGSTVYITKRRHLENLSTDISGIGGSGSVNVTTAKLRNNIDFSKLSDFIDPSSTSWAIYSASGVAYPKTVCQKSYDGNFADFVGIHNDTLTSFDGQGNTLVSLIVKGEDPANGLENLTGVSDAALFTSLGASEVNIQNINFTTSHSSSSAGSAALVLAKTSGNGRITISHVIASGSTRLHGDSTNGNVGAIVGTAEGDGTLSINNCLFKDVGEVSSKKNAGGIVGWTSGTEAINLAGCNVTGPITITATTNGGGLVGSIGTDPRIDQNIVSKNTVNIKYCSASITSVSAGQQTGGLIGGCYGKSIIIDDCYAGGQNMYVHCTAQTKKSNTFSAGGFIGELRTDGKINNSAASCYVDASTSDCAGGFIGSLKSSNTISNCYVGGHTDSDGKFKDSPYNSNNNQVPGGYNVIGYTATGGFIGYMVGTIEISNCFTAASVNGATTTTDTEAAYGYIGGFLGQTQANSQETFMNCYAAGKIFGGGHNTTAYGGAFIGNINTRPLVENGDRRSFNLKFNSNDGTQPNYVLEGMTYRNELGDAFNNDDEFVGTDSKYDEVGYNDHEKAKAAISDGIRSITAADLSKLAVNHIATTARFNGSGNYPYPVHTSLPDYSKSVIISENGSVSAQAYNRIYYGDWEALVSQSTQTSDTSYTIRFSLSKPNVNNSYLAGSTINISDFYLTDSNGKKIDYSSDSWHYSVVVSEGLTVNNFNVTINKKVAEGDFNITVKLTNKNNINIDTDSDVQTTVKIHVVPLPTTELFRKNERVYIVNGNAVKGYIWPQSYVEDDWQFDYNVPDGYYYDGGNPSILYQITGLSISGGDIKARTLATLLSWGRAGIKRVNEVTDSGASSGSAVASQAKQNSPAGWTEEPQQTVTKKIKVKKAS